MDFHQQLASEVGSPRQTMATAIFAANGLGILTYDGLWLQPCVQSCRRSWSCFTSFGAPTPATAPGPGPDVMATLKAGHNVPHNNAIGEK